MWRIWIIDIKLKSAFTKKYIRQKTWTSQTKTLRLVLCFLHFPDLKLNESLTFEYIKFNCCWWNMCVQMLFISSVAKTLYFTNYTLHSYAIFLSCLCYSKLLQITIVKLSELLEIAMIRVWLSSTTKWLSHGSTVVMVKGKKSWSCPSQARYVVSSVSDERWSFFKIQEKVQLPLIQALEIPEHDLC